MKLRVSIALLIVSFFTLFAADNGPDYTWLQNPPSENVTGYKLYFGSNARVSGSVPSDQEQSGYTWVYETETGLLCHLESSACYWLQPGVDVEYTQSGDRDYLKLDWDKVTEVTNATNDVIRVDKELFAALTAYRSTDDVESGFTSEIKYQVDTKEGCFKTPNPQGCIAAIQRIN